MKKYIFLIFTVFSILFASCTNGLDDVNPVIPFPVQPVSTVTITGNLSVSGAFPSSVVELVETTERTVYPTFASASYWQVYAEKYPDDGTKISATNIAADHSSYTITIPATADEVTYKLFATVSTAASNGLQILYAESLPFPISSINSVVSKNLELTASDVGSGCMAIPVTVAGDSGIVSAKVTYKQNGTTKTVNATVDGTTYTFSAGTISGNTITNGMPSGNYSMTFQFYSAADCTGDLLYSFTQGVNIFDSLTTNTWVKSGNEAYLNSTESGGVITTTCNVTKALVDDFATTVFFVHRDYGATPAAGGLGTSAKPFSRIEHAIEKMNDASKDYTVYVTRSGGNGILATVIEDPEGSTIQAHSITISGLQDVPSNGIPNDFLEGKNENNNKKNAVVIKTTVPITFKKIQICDGGTPTTTGATNRGAGIDIEKEGAVVNLANDVCVNSNSATANTSSIGGGVYVCAGATLNLLNGSCIGDGDPDGSFTHDCRAVLGGGIYNAGTVNMYEGSVIRDCRVLSSGTISNGGGIYCAVDSYFNMYGGTIEACKAQGYSSSTNPANDKESYGGGIYIVQSVGGVRLYGGTIKDCYAKTAGAAILTASMPTKGTHLKGSIYIPSNGANGTNDIYVNGSMAITIDGDLTKHSTSDKIKVTPNLYSSNRQYFKKSDDITGEVYKSVLKKFEITDEPGAANPSWSINARGGMFHPIGTKLYPDAVGDIVYNDGSADPADISDSDLTPKKSYAIAVICYKYDTYEPHKLYGLSLKQASNKAWCKSGVAGATAEVGTFNFTHDLDGIGNMEILKTYAGANYTEENYPAFWWADHYSTTATNLGSYNTGWCLPARNELYGWCDNDTILNTVTSSLSKIGTTYADSLNNTYSGGYWTSSEQGSTQAIILYVAYHTTNRLESKTKTSGYFVRAVRDFIND